MSHIYVVAGTFDQAKTYISNKRADYAISGEPPLLMPNYLAVTNVVHLKGIRNPTGVLIGTWREREDIIEILETLMLASDLPNKALAAAYDELMPKRKPTPKIRPTSDDAVSIAAGHLAKEIDEQVLKQLLGVVSVPNSTAARSEINEIIKNLNVWTMSKNP
jgi:hypothetical protein